MSRNPQLRIVIVGRDVSIAPLERTLVAEGASNYICVPTLDAADWLVRDGFDADLLIVHQPLLPTTSDLLDLRRRLPQAIILPTSAHCDAAAVHGALASARRRREQAAAAARTARPSLFPSLVRRFAMG